MALDGVWSMSDDGEFTLNEPYKTKLAEARYAATCAWTSALLNYLMNESPYTVDELKDALLSKPNGDDVNPNGFVNEFILEALSGDL